MDGLQRTQQRRAAYGTRHATSVFLVSPGVILVPVLWWFPGGGFQGDGQELPPSLFQRILLSAVIHTLKLWQIVALRIIPKIPIPTVLICELCSSQRDLLQSFLVVNTAPLTPAHFLTNARITKDSLTLCSNWGQRHIILTACLKQEAKSFLRVTVMSLKVEFLIKYIGILFYSFLCW